jgi:TetR/AcrR family transcriptional regulator, transcriptional repressor for nem operon
MPRPREFEQEKVLEKAMQLFWEKGYEATSISDLEEHLGLGRQSIYNVFGDKRQIFLKALASYAQTSCDVVDRLLIHGHEGLESIRAYLLTSVDFVASSKRRRACLIVNTIMENATADPDVGATCRMTYQSLIRGFRAALQRAVDRGEIPPKTDVAATATMLAAQEYGMSVLAKTGVSPAELTRTVNAFVERLK